MSERSYCTFVLDGQLFGIDVGRVQEVLREQPITPVPLAASYVAGLLNLRGHIVTAIDLRERLGQATGPRPVTNVLVIEPDGGTSLLVDRAGEVVTVHDDQFESCPDTFRGPAREFVRGVYKLDSELLLILDLERVLEAQGAERMARAS